MVFSGRPGITIGGFKKFYLRALHKRSLAKHIRALRDFALRAQSVYLSIGEAKAPGGFDSGFKVHPLSILALSVLARSANMFFRYVKLLSNT